MRRYEQVSGAFFCLVAAAQLTRVLLGWPVQVADVAVPLSDIQNSLPRAPWDASQGCLDKDYNDYDSHASFHDRPDDVVLLYLQPSDRR